MVQAENARIERQRQINDLNRKQTLEMIKAR